mgnify:CR=1 FL=1
MKILYDYQIFLTQKYGGISRYFAYLIKELAQKHTVAVPTFFQINSYLGEIKRVYPRIKYTGRFLAKINKLLTKITIESFKPDIVHPTYYDPYIVQSCKKRNSKFVITVHDMIHEMFPQYFGKKDLDWTYKAKYTTITSADLIITVSRTTKNDLIRVYGIDEKKIRVVYHGTQFLDFWKSKYSSYSRIISDGYVLFVGNRHGYKNFNFLVKSLENTLKRHKIKLICAGGGKFNSEEKKLISELSLESYIESIPYVDEYQLWNLYRGAEFFVFPSLYEGFGIPILEAWASKCPVLLSDIPVFREIASNHALFFDPRSEKDLNDKFEIMLSDYKLRKEIVENSWNTVQDFSIHNMVSNTERCYKEILNS